MTTAKPSCSELPQVLSGRTCDAAMQSPSSSIVKGFEWAQVVQQGGTPHNDIKWRGMNQSRVVIADLGNHHAVVLDLRARAVRRNRLVDLVLVQLIADATPRGQAIVHELR